METYLELNPNLPAEYRELRDSVHRFARDVMRPAAIVLDRIADPVRVEFQFRRQLASEISRCSVVASDMTQGLLLGVRVRHCVQPA